MSVASEFSRAQIKAKYKLKRSAKGEERQRRKEVNIKESGAHLENSCKIMKKNGVNLYLSLSLPLSFFPSLPPHL
jgi:hypothetical protein